MALTFARPALTRHHLLRAAARQFVEAQFVEATSSIGSYPRPVRVCGPRSSTSGDAAILDEVVPFREGRALGETEHDTFFAPPIADETASLSEHCARGLDQCLALTGERGLPLIGSCPA